MSAAGTIHEGEHASRGAVTDINHQPRIPSRNPKVGAWKRRIPPQDLTDVKECNQRPVHVGL
jgi:hypothetical protein